MKLTTKSSSSSEGWGMGFLLVFFPEEDQTQNNQNEIKKPSSFNLLSPPSSSSSPIKRTNSSNLLYKAQYTISICLLLLFATLLLFTLSTLPPSAATTAARRLYRSPARRHLREVLATSPPPSNLSRALQGVGTLYRRGTRAMSDAVVAHAPESLSPNELRLFLRLFLRSSLAAKSDLLLIFPSKTANLNSLILQEHESFSKLLAQYKSSNDSLSKPSFDVTHFTRLSKKERESGETIWGQKNRTNHGEEGGTKSNRPNYGSIVGFDADELDPENSLSGFFDHVPMGLRRWACYPMLLGRVRRNFKHVMLVDIKDILILGDPLGRVRNQSPESVLLKAATQSNSGKHGKKSPEKTDPTRKTLAVHPGIVMGGSRGVRKLSAAMLTHIVRVSIQHKKKKNSVTESGIFNHLVGNNYAIKNVNLIVSNRPLPDLSSLSGSKSGSHQHGRSYGVIRRGNCNVDAVNSMVMKHICSFPIDSSVYSDCKL